MRGKALTAAGLAILAGIAAPGASSADGAHSLTGGPRAGEHLVWSQYTDTDFTALRIVISGPYGNHVRHLTNPPDDAQDIDPKISPDGTRVLYERDLPDGSTQIRLVGIGGGNDHAIDLGCVDPCAVDLTPTWAPDSAHLLYTPIIGPFDQANGSATSAVLYESDLDGDGAVRISEPGIDGVYEDYGATFAPAGYIVFVRVRNADIKSAVYRMDADGSNVRRLTAWRIDADLPMISPATHGRTKDLVVFETFGHGAPDGVSAAVATVSAAPGASRHVRYLTPRDALPEQNFNVSWSPDGRRVAFCRFSFDDASGEIHGDIWTTRWNGTHERPISESPLFEFRPNWGPAPSAS